MSDTTYCDNCAKRVALAESCPVSALPLSVASANEGESATLCVKCHKQLMEDFWGPKCLEHNEDCFLCKAWEVFENSGRIPETV